MTLSGQVGPAPSCVVNNKHTAMPARQTSCTFSIGSGGATVNGTINADGTVSVDVGSGMLGCAYSGNSITGTGTISGSTITGTADSSSPPTHVNFAIRKP